MEFPRLIYRGEQDVLGSGQVGETKRVNSQDELDTAVADGWRLTSAPDPEPAADGGDDDVDQARAAGDAGDGASDGAGGEPDKAKASAAKKAAAKKK